MTEPGGSARRISDPPGRRGIARRTGHWPDGTSWLGIALIGGTGLYVFYRETARGPQNVLTRPMPRNR